MKLRFAIIAMLLASLVLFGSVNVAHAQWSAINSDQQCAVTTDWHKLNIPMGELVTATAGTADSLVKYVNFVWHDPDGNVIWSVIVSLTGPITTPAVPPSPIPQEIVDWADEHDGTHYQGGNLIPTITYWYAQNAQTPNIVGDWGVQAIFLTLDHLVRGKNSDIVATRSTSFFVMPEVPFGTIALLLSWFGILGVFALRKKHNPS